MQAIAEHSEGRLSQRALRTTLIATLFAAVLVAAFFASARTALAQTGTGGFGTCIVDENCTAGDTTVATLERVGGDTECQIGGVANVIVQGEIKSTADKRYDIGLWVALDGKVINDDTDPAQECYVDLLQPLADPPTSTVDAGNPLGAGPYHNLDADFCGDIEQNDPSTFKRSSLITVQCVDNNFDGQLDVSAAVSWEQNAGVACTSLDSIITGTPAKCFVGTFQVADVVVNQTGTIEIVKDVYSVIDPDGGRFNLQIDGQTVLTDAYDTNLAIGISGTITSTGRVTVSAGTSITPGNLHIVGEVAGTGTNLDDYSQFVECVNRAEVDLAAAQVIVGTQPVSVTVYPGDDWLCTLYNNRLSGLIEVQKVLIPPTDPGLFNLTISGTNGFSFTAENLGNGGTTGQVIASPGLVTVVESSGTDTNLFDYYSELSCVDLRKGNAPIQIVNGQFEIYSGFDVSCTFTNTRAPGYIQITKVTQPVEDSTVFSYTASWAQAVITLTGENGSNTYFSGPLQPGAYTIIETPSPGWALAGYSCSESEPKEVAAGVAQPAGQLIEPVVVNLESFLYVTCTFTNVVATASLGDRVWYDIKPDGINTPDRLAGDGLQNGEVGGAAGVTVQLWSTGPDGAYGGGDDSLFATETTDDQGNYEFTDVPAGSYYLVFINGTGTGAWSTNFNAGADNTIDSDLILIDGSDPTIARTDVFSIALGQNDPTWDAALVDTSGAGSSDLGDFVWNDVNQNGIQDSGEDGLPNVVVELYAEANPIASGTITETLLLTDVTDANGIYGFQALDPGTYVVRFVKPEGYTVSPQGSGVDDEVDSDMDAATGRTEPITLTQLTVDLSWDAGMYLTPTADWIPDEPFVLRLFLPAVQK